MKKYVLIILIINTYTLNINFVTSMINPYFFSIVDDLKIEIENNK